MDETISVIIPVYKVEDYLKKCLDSIIAQSYSNLEIILVDDGSPDNCPAICDEYSKLDKRVKVIHKKNAGLSSARNAGIDIATGKYVVFIDGDDYIHKQMFEILHINMKENNADISICNFTKVVNLDYEDSPVTSNSISVFSGAEAMGNLYGECYLPTVVAWNKLYKRSVFNDLRYPLGKFHEDEFIIHRILDKAKLVVYTDASLYYYVQRNDSIMGKSYNLNRLDYLLALEERMLFFKQKNYLPLYKKTLRAYLRAIIRQYDLVRKYFPKEKAEICQNLRLNFKKYYSDNPFCFSFKDRMKFEFFLVRLLLLKLGIEKL